MSFVMVGDRCAGEIEGGDEDSYASELSQHSCYQRFDQQRNRQAGVRDNKKGRGRSSNRHDSGNPRWFTSQAINLGPVSM